MRRRPRSALPNVTTIWLCTVATAFAARSGQGQSAFRGSIDAGTATLQQPEVSKVTAPTLSTDLRLDAARFALRAVGGAAFASDDRWSAQLDLGGSWMARLSDRAALELAGTGTATRYRAAPGAASGAIVARQHLALDAAGVWLGAGGGMLTRQQGRSAPLVTAEVGGWMRAGNLRTSLTVAAQRARLDSVLRIAGVNILPRRHNDPLTAVDATLLGEWRTSRLELAGSAAVRQARRQSPDALWSLYTTGAVNLVPRVAITGSHADLAADPLRSVPKRRATMLGVRLRFGATSVGAVRVALPAADVVMRGERRVLRVRTARDVASVDVRGEFTHWRPTPLVRGRDGWELPITADAGTVRLTLRLDGGAWVPPANVPSVADEFGERVGLVVVP